MITIFHGDDAVKSRDAFLSAVTPDTTRIDSKNIDLNQINNLLNEGSLFGETKTISINNYFSIPKANLDKLTKILLTTKLNIFIWQDKPLNATQLKTFPAAKVITFKASNELFTCLNSIKPKNLIQFIKLYDKVVEDNQFDLFLYLLKGNFRRKLNETTLRTYLQVIELEYQYKSGQLSLPKEMALKRVLLPLLK